MLASAAALKAHGYRAGPMAPSRAGPAIAPIPKWALSSFSIAVLNLPKAQENSWFSP